jgi:TonB family protein
MKFGITILSLFCFVMASALSQDTILIFMNDKYMPVNQQECTIIRQAIVKNNVYFVRDYRANGIPILKGTFNSKNPWIENGFFKYFKEDGSLYAIGNYSEGYMIGKWIFFDKQKPDTVDYSRSYEKLEKTNTLSTFPVPYHDDCSNDQKYFISQKLHFPPRPFNDYCLLVAEITIGKDGKRIPRILKTEHVDFSFEAYRFLMDAPESFFSGLRKIAKDKYLIDLQFEKMETDSLGNLVKAKGEAEFQGGGINTFREWVQKHVIYPPMAVENGEFGRVTVEITVNEEGKVQDAKILKGVSKLLDKETLRVVNSSPLWSPAILHGLKIKEKFVFPVIFMLQ